LSGNQLTSLTLPAGLTNLTTLGLECNHLTSLTLPPGLENLTYLDLGGIPLMTLVLPEPLALTRLADTVASLRSEGVSVYTYPLAVSLVTPRRTVAGAVGFTLTGPPASYTILGSTDLAAWNELGTLTNTLGAAVFTDAQATNSSQKFFRARADIDFEYEGEMPPELALDPEARANYPFMRLTAPANVLIMPAIHSASISTKLVQALGGATVVGPILVGLSKSVQICPLSASVSKILTMAQMAAYEQPLVEDSMSSAA